MPGSESQSRAARAFSPEQYLDKYRTLLRESKLRVTGVRLVILKLFEESNEALTAQQVFDLVCQGAPGKKAPKGGRRPAGGMPDRVTVYRTLNSLVDAGIAHRVDPGDRVFRFSLTDHARCTEHHHVHEHPHFVCDKCGKVECMQNAEVIVKTRESDAAHARRNIRLQDVVLHGTCEQCTDSPKSSR